LDDMEVPAVEETLPRAELRRANIGDAMIVMVAFAVGLAGSFRALSDIREWSALITPMADRSVWMAWWTEIARRQGLRFQVVQGCVQLLYCFIVPITPALLVARLRRPRPPVRRLACQPGFAASLALCLVVVIAMIDVDLTFFDVGSFPPLLMMVLPGAAVLASWSILVATGRWHLEPSWVDRAGCLVGAFWLATIPWSIWIAY
jgi:hypothetical protein